VVREGKSHGKLVKILATPAWNVQVQWLIELLDVLIPLNWMVLNRNN